MIRNVSYRSAMDFARNLANEFGMILTSEVLVSHQVFTRLLFFADSSFVAIAFITDLSSLEKKKKSIITTCISSAQISPFGSSVM